MAWTENWEDLTDEDLQEGIDQYVAEAVTLAFKIHHNPTESEDAKRLANLFGFIDGFLSDDGPLPTVWVTPDEKEDKSD